MLAEDVGADFFRHDVAQVKFLKIIDIALLGVTSMIDASPRANDPN